MTAYQIKITTEKNGHTEVRHFKPSYLEGGSDSAQAILNNAKRDTATVECCCKRIALLMHIKQRKQGYSVCRNPNTGNTHHPLCDRYAAPHALSGRQGYSEKAVKRVDDVIVVSPDFSLTLCKPSANTLSTPTSTTSGTKRNTVTLLGLFNVIFEQAGFNRWTPKMKDKRQYKTFSYYISKTLEGMRFSRGKSMADNVVVVSPHYSLRTAVNNVCKAGQKTPKRRCVVIGRIQCVTKARVHAGEQTYALKHISDNDSVPFFIRDAQWRQCQRSYMTAAPSGDNFTPDTTQYYLVISVVSMNKRGSLNIEQCAVMPTTRDFIPYDSSHEHNVAQTLVEQDRAFEKPLRYDSTEVTFPDFMLHDVGETPIPMEVYGITNKPAYTKRKHEKNLYYKTHYPNFWSWDVGMMPTMPAFPAKVST